MITTKDEWYVNPDGIYANDHLDAFIEKSEKEWVWSLYGETAYSYEDPTEWFEIASGTTTTLKAAKEKARAKRDQITDSDALLQYLSEQDDE